MLYKRFISTAVLVLLAIAIVVALWLTRGPGVQKPKVDFTNRIHTSLYQNSTDSFDAAIQTFPFTNSPETGIHLEWQKPTQTYNHFLVTVTDAQTGWTRTESGEHERVTLDVTDLQPDTKYSFTIRACSDPKCSSWIIASEEVHARTTSKASP